MKKLIYKNNFIWNMIGLSFYALVSFSLLIIVKLVNGTDIAGVFSYSFSLCTLFFYVSIYYNRTYQLSNSQFKFDKFFSCRLFTAMISFILIIIFSVISGFNINKILIISALMVFRTSDAISDCLYGVMQSNEKLYQVGISYTLKSIIGILFFTICDILTNNLLLSILLLDVVNILIFFIYDIKCCRKAICDFRGISFNNFDIIKASFSVFVFSFLSVYLINSQKYVITYFSSNELQAIFGILVMPATIISLIGNYLIQPFLTRFIKFFNDKKYDDFNKLVLKIVSLLFGIGMFLLIILYFVGIPILNIIYQIDLNKYKLDFLIIVFGSIFIAISVIFSGILTIFNKNRVQVLIYLIVSIISTILCSLLARGNVIFGASISYFISSLLLVIMFIVVYFINLNKKKKEVI